MRKLYLTESDIKNIVLKVIKEVVNQKILFDISKISKEQSDKQYVNFKTIMVPDNYGSIFFKDEDNKYILDEIEKSLPLSEVKEIIVKRFDLEDWQFRIISHANNIEIALLIPHIDTNKEILEDDMMQLGYFLGTTLPIVMNGKNWLQMQFEPIYQDDKTNELKNGDYLFHITPKYNLESIKQQGILPKSENSLFNYPPRIYLLKSDVTPTEFIDFIKKLNARNKNPLNTGEYCILRISTRKLPENVQLFLDPNYEKGCWTNNKIPYKCINGIIEYNINRE